MLARIAAAYVFALVLASGGLSAQVLPGAAGADAAAVAAVQRHLRADVPVVIVDREGRQHDGFVQRASVTVVAIATNGRTEEFAFRDIGLIVKPGDSLLNGALLGTAAGSPYWLLMTAFACDSRGAVCGAATGLGTAGIFAALGAYIDSRRRGRTVIHGPTRGGRASQFSDLWMSVESGDRVTVTGADGSKTSGVFQRAESGSLTVLVDGRIRTFAETDVRRVARRGDSLRNGTLIGVALGVLPFLAPCNGTSTTDCLDPGERLFGAGFGALVFGSLGALVDSLIVRHTDVYRSSGGGASLHIAPDLEKGRRGVRLAVTF